MKKLIFFLLFCSCSGSGEESPFIDNKNLNRAEVTNFENCAKFNFCEDEKN